MPAGAACRARPPGWQCAAQRREPAPSMERGGAVSRLQRVVARRGACLALQTANPTATKGCSMLPGVWLGRLGARPSRPRLRLLRRALPALLQQLNNLLGRGALPGVRQGALVYQLQHLLQRETAGQGGLSEGGCPGGGGGGRACDGRAEAEGARSTRRCQAIAAAGFCIAKRAGAAPAWALHLVAPAGTLQAPRGCASCRGWGSPRSLSPCNKKR